MTHLMTLTLHFSNQVLHHLRQVTDHRLVALAVFWGIRQCNLLLKVRRFRVINLLDCQLLLPIFRSIFISR